VSGPIGVNPVDAMSQAQEAEALAEAMVFLGTDFEAAVEGLTGAVSEHVSGGLDDYGLDTMERIRGVARNGINLAQNVQGADLAITDTDHENAEEYREGLESLDIQINF
jgi:division protein CdvB (Snf7/Vps24/ESCRT-III family)